MLNKDQIFELEERVGTIECLVLVLDCFTHHYDKDYAKGMACANIISSHILYEAGKVIKMF